MNLLIGSSNFTKDALVGQPAREQRTFPVFSPLRQAGLDAARAAQCGQRVLPVVAAAAQAHVDGLAARVHAADGGVAHAAHAAVPTQGALPALGRGGAERGAPRQAVGGACGGVD